MPSLISFNNISKDFKVSIRKENSRSKFLSLLTRQHKIINALKDVSFEVNEGDIVGYIGPNGAGKSTTIKIMSGILTPTSGTCVINGYIPWKNRKEYVKNIGVVFGQRSQLWWDLPILDSFKLLKDIYKIPNEVYEQNLTLLNQTLQLESIINQPLRQLSLGQKMKCELAGALLHKPKILFLDEPTIGLDAVTKLAVRDFIKRINKDWGTTVILTTHDMNDIEALTNKIILIGRGEVLYNGSFSEIKNKYGHQKTISVEFSKEYKTISVPGYEVVSHNKNMAVFKNESNTDVNVKNFITIISEKYDVVDFSIESIGVDEILAKVYIDYKL